MAVLVLDLNSSRKLESNQLTSGKPRRVFKDGNFDSGQACFETLNGLLEDSNTVEHWPTLVPGWF